jgi:SAM-dependent methyltransferase
VNANKERVWWDDADDADIFGEPPYDVVRVAQRLLNEIPDRRRLLDLGCGTGRMTNHMARILGGHGHVTGLDISKALVERAVVSAPDNAHYWRGDGRTIPAGISGQFTGAYSITVFQHIPEEAMWGYIRQVHDLLVPGGTFIFTIAHGETDKFLNHQTHSLVKFGNDLSLIFDKVSVDHTPDERGWYWVLARKEAR